MKNHSLLSRITQIYFSTNLVGLQEVKDYAKITNSAEDALIQSLISSAESLIEAYAAISVRNQLQTLYYQVENDVKIEIDYAPHQSFEFAVAKYSNGTEKLLVENEDFSVQQLGSKVIFTSICSFSKNTLLELQMLSGVVSAEYEYSDELPIYESLKTAIKMTVAHLYENRNIGADAEGKQKYALPENAKQTLNLFKQKSWF